MHLSHPKRKDEAPALYQPPALAVNEPQPLSCIGEPDRPAIGQGVDEPATANGNPMTGHNYEQRILKFPIGALALPAGKARRFAAEIRLL